MTDTKDMPELLPCPLCGGKSGFLSANYGIIGILHGIECTECGLWLDCRERSESDAAAIWNRRSDAAVTALMAERDAAISRAEQRGTASKFAIGDRVRKHSGSWWEGIVVGTYSTAQTPIGYAVQLDGVGNGPVQIYPEAALVLK